MYTILVLCTGNSARSILSEAVLHHAGEGEIMAVSAGSKPVGAVNPVALELLDLKGLALKAPRSKSWDEFAKDGPYGQPIDLVITVCDNAAGETCPIWPGAPLTLHWSFPDPAGVGETAEEKMAAFETVFSDIEPRMRALALAVRRGLRGEALKDFAAAQAPA